MVEDKKTSIYNVIHVRTYRVLERAIEEGIECGWNRGVKYNDNTISSVNADSFKSEILSAIMLNIDELFIFPELED